MKNKLEIYAVRKPFQLKGHTWAQSEGVERDIPLKWKPKESRGNYTYNGQNRLSVKTLTRDKEGHYVIIKESVHQEDITIINTYAPNIGEPKYIKRILGDLQGETARQEEQDSMPHSQ